MRIKQRRLLLAFILLSGVWSMAFASEAPEKRNFSANSWEVESFPPPCPNPPVIQSIDITNTSCGQISGAITVHMAGNTGDYSYSWSPDLSSTNTMTGLVAGAYRLTVTDNSNPDCFTDTIIVVQNTDGPQATVQSTSPTICESANGQAVLQPAELNYVWDDLGSGNFRNNLTEKTYSVTVTDPASGCYSVLLVPIGSTNPLSTIVGINEPATCNQANGTATIDVQGGSGNYSFSWGTSATNSSLPAGDYAVQVVDNDNGCVDTAYFTMPAGSSIGSISIASISPASCNGGSDGAVEFTIDEGFPFGEPASVVIKNQDGLEKLNGFLQAGPYTAYLHDAGGCIVDSIQFQMTENSSLVVTPSVIPQTCTVGGVISLDVSGGVPPYTYDWEDLPGSDDPKDRIDLVAGNYAVTVRDALGCQYVIGAINVGDDCGSGSCANPVIITDIIINQANCGSFNGSAKIFINGDINDYEWEWSPASGVLVAPNERHSLGLGTYSVTITDKLNNACFTTRSFAVTNADGPQAQVLSTTPVTCNTTNGGATIGPDNYTYTWADGSHATQRSDLPEGYNFVTVTDGNCENILTILIDDLKTLDAYPVINNLPDCGLNNGSVTIEIPSGSGSYSYDWGAGATHNGLAAGSYDVLVADLQTGCDTVVSFILNDNVPQATVTINGPVFTTCAGDNDGTVDFSVDYSPGFIDPATIEIHDHADSLVNNGELFVGPHCIVVKDGNGCIAGQACFYVNSPLAINIYSSVSPVTCTTSGSINLTVSGGDGGYTFDWLDLAGNMNPEDRTGLSPGAYSVTITDGNGCSASQSVNVPDICGCDVFAGSISADSTDICDQKPNMIISASPDGNAVIPAGYEVRYLLSKSPDGKIKQIATAPQFTVAGSGLFIIHTFIFDPATFDLATIDLGQTTIYDVNLQLIQGGGLICAGLDMEGAEILINKCTVCNLPDPMATVTDAHCGVADGAITLEFEQDTTGFQFEWSPPVSNSATVTDIEAGAYYVTVSEYGDEACAISMTIVVTNEDGPQVTIDSIAPTICTASNGFLRLSPVTLDYLWENGSTSYVRSSLTDTLYAIKATDPNTGCFSMLGVEIPKIDPMDASVEIISEPFCGQPNGHAKITVTGGSDHYTYTWGNFNEKDNLPPGQYSVGVVDMDYGCSEILEFELIDQPKNLIQPDSLFLQNGQCGQNYPLCLDLPASNAFGYTFIDNGLSYSGNILACGTDTVVYYDISIFNSGDQFTLAWPHNGTNHTALADDAATVLDSFTSWDPFSGWIVDDTMLIATNPQAAYDDILVINNITGVTSILSIQGKSVEQGVQLSLPQGTHDLHILENATGCRDTLFVDIECINCPDLYSGPDTIWGGICGQDSGYICLDIAPDQMAGYTIRDNWEPYSGELARCGQGTQLTLTQGHHTLIITNDATLCSDTVKVLIFCVPPADFVIDTFLYEHDAISICFDNSLLTGNPIYAAELCEPFGPQLVSQEVQFPDFCTHIEGLSLGRDTLCYKVCDDAGDCSVTYIYVNVLPRIDTLEEFVTLTTTRTICVDTSLFAEGIVAVQNLCPSASGTAIGVSLNGTSGCFDVEGLAIGVDTVCLQACDAYGNCDTTVYLIECGIPKPDTINVEIIIYNDTMLCVDQSELPGTLETIDPICADLPGLAIFELSASTACLEITGAEYGQDTLCLEFCDNQFCDTLVIAVDIIQDTTQAPIANDDEYRIAYNRTETFNPLENDLTNGTLDTMVITVPPKWGEATVNSDYTITYTPRDGVCMVNDSIVYTLVNKNGTDNAVIHLNLDCYEVLVSTALSPNGDGVNDFLYIEDIDKYPDNEVFIYNRWGNLVFHRKGYSNSDPWDGLWKETNLTTGTYFYIINLNNGNGKIYRGYIQIQR